MFRPEVGNVAFGSAVDGWAFTAGQFAEIYAKKLGASPDVLKKALWGDFCYHAKVSSLCARTSRAGLSRHRVEGAGMRFRFITWPTRLWRRRRRSWGARRGQPWA